METGAGPKEDSEAIPCPGSSRMEYMVRENSARMRPNEIHVDLSGGLISTLTLDQVRVLLKWVNDQQGQVTRFRVIPLHSH